MAVAAGSGITTVITVGTTPVQLVATNTQRRGLRIINQGASTFYVGFGTGNAVTTGMEPVVSTTGSLIAGPLQPELGGRISLPSNVPSGDVSAISAATNASCVITEW